MPWCRIAAFRQKRSRASGGCSTSSNRSPKPVPRNRAASLLLRHNRPMIWWVAQTACVSALLAAIVALVGRVGRLSPAVKHALWLLVLVKLVTPPVVSYPLPTAAEATLARWTEFESRRTGDGGGRIPGSLVVPPAPEGDCSTVDLSEEGTPSLEPPFSTTFGSSDAA